MSDPARAQAGANLESGRSAAYQDPLAWFRILFFAGLLLHFAPTLLHPNASFGPDAFRTREWDPWLYELAPSLPGGVIVLLSGVAGVSLLLGLAGVALRFAVISSAVSLYVLCSFNSYYLQTLALVGVWAVLWLWSIVGDRRELLRRLLAAYFLLAVLLSGIAKLEAGWLVESRMSTLLAYPRGHVVRAWLVGLDPDVRAKTGAVLQAVTLAVELGAPVLMLWPRTKILGQWIYQAFFLGIVAALEVPPLFYSMYAGGGLLSLPHRGATAPERSAGPLLRGAIALWVATCVLGAFDHQLALGAFARDGFVNRVFPYTRYGYVMFADLSPRVGVLDYAEAHSATVHPLADAFPVGAWGYANARAQLNSMIAPDSVRWLCRSGHLPADSTLRLRIHEVRQSAEPVRTVRWRCSAGRLVRGDSDGGRPQR